jgi:hypothetical protein
MTTQSKALQDARLLSSGTISHLIMRTDYEAIDRAQRLFLEFIAKMDEAATDGPCFASWQDAWETFRQTAGFYDAALGPADDVAGPHAMAKGVAP